MELGDFDLLLPSSLSIQAANGEVWHVSLVVDPKASDVERWQSNWCESDLSRGASAQWNWSTKLASVRQQDLDTMFIAASESDECQAMMILSWPHASSRGGGKQLVYVEYLEVAPKNRPDAGSRRHLKGVGAALLELARRVSATIGCQGLALHSLQEAEGFYRNFGMTDFGPDPLEQELRYFEL